MRRLINPLWLLWTQSSHKDLVRQLEFLKEENRILRSKLGRQVRVTVPERERLITLGRRVGPMIRHLVSIVTPHTFDRWLGGEQWKEGTRPRKPGRPRKPDEIRELVLRIASETGWGYTRILGELKKLGITTISRSTVVNILRENDIDPGPKRGLNTWDDFLKRHAETLWACDFMGKRVLTLRGWREAFFIVFINIATRRVWASPCSFKPKRKWTAQQAIAFIEAHRNDPNAPRIVLHDRDSKFQESFKRVIRRTGATPLMTQRLSPNMNAYAERIVQTIQQECLDYFVVMGRRHLDYLVKEYLEHYHLERPHQSLGNAPPVRAGPRRLVAKAPANDDVKCVERLGGLLKSYRRAA